MQTDLVAVAAATSHPIGRPVPATVEAARHVESAPLPLAALRRTHYARLDVDRHAYLDYTGAALYSSMQIESDHRRLLRDVLGNPHSENPAAAASTERMERVRARVLEFFHADPGTYDVVFTANASAALRLVGESFPFEPGSRLVLTADNHNSVNGIRCYAGRAGAATVRVPLRAELRSAAPLPSLEDAPRDRAHLFAYPAQSNFSGVRHPLDWVHPARENGYRVFLDAAAFTPTAPLDIGAVNPDFVCVSFYKMFGFPTGIGALIARRDALALLRRPWFAGGTVDWVSTQYAGHALTDGPHAFEDGTPHFLAFDAVRDGLDLLDGIGMSRIAAHAQQMTALLLDWLLELTHPGGEPLIEVYGPTDPGERGATVAFNVLDQRGAVVPFQLVVAAAARQRVSVRGGCFCNPGCAEAAFAFAADRSRTCRDALADDYSIEGFAACMGSPVGAVRASCGIPTTPADLERLVEVLGTFRGSTGRSRPSS